MKGYIVMHGNILKLVSSIHTQAKSYLVNKLKHHDFTYSDGRVLHFIAEHTGANQEEIATALQINKSAVAQMINKLESKKQIYREPSIIDKRNKKVYLTPSGENNASLFGQLLEDTNKLIINQLSPYDRNALFFMLKQINSTILSLKENS